MKDAANPMHPAQRLLTAPRCTARAKRTGQPCQAPAVCGWSVCRMHGAGGGHPAGQSHPSWKHGMRSSEWIEERRRLGQLLRASGKIWHMI